MRLRASTGRGPKMRRSLKEPWGFGEKGGRETSESSGRGQRTEGELQGENSFFLEMGMKVGRSGSFSILRRGGRRSGLVAWGFQSFAQLPAKAATKAERNEDQVFFLGFLRVGLPTRESGTSSSIWAPA